MDLINKYLQEQTPGHEYEYDYEGDMAKTQLNMMIDASMELKSMLANDTNLPEWVQSKITKAADYIDSARDYMKNMNKDSNGNMHNEPMGEETKDTGWQKAQADRKDQYGNRIKNVARRLARQGMQAAVKDLKKGPEAGKRQVEEVELDEEEGFSPSGHRKLATHHFNKAKELYQKADSTGDSYGADHLNDIAGKHATAYRAHKEASTDPTKSAEAHKASREANDMIESVEQISELKPRTLASYTSKAADQMAHAAIDKSTGAAMGTMGRMSDMPDLAKQGTDKEDKAFKTILKRSKGISSASRRLAKEEAELGEELSSSQRDTHFSLMNKHGLLAKSAKGANKDAHRMAALDHQMALRNPENSQSRSKALSLSNKLGVKEDVELDESLKKKLAAMGVAATMAASPAAARVSDGGQSFAKQTAQQSSQSQSVKAPKEIPSKSYLQNVASGKSRSMMNPDTAKELLKKHYSEEVDLISKYSNLGEGKYGAFRLGPGVGRFSSRGRAQHQGLTDPRTDLPLGFSNPPKKDEPKKEEPPKKTS